MDGALQAAVDITVLLKAEFLLHGDTQFIYIKTIWLMLSMGPIALSYKWYDARWGVTTFQIRTP